MRILNSNLNDMPTELITMTTLMSIASAVSVIGGAWLMIRKIAKDAERSKKNHAAIILQSAKEADSLMKIKLETKIHDLEAEFKNYQENIEKDIEHLKSTYNNEIKNLGEKIENLRDEVNNHHSQIIGLLSKMLDRD